MIPLAEDLNTEKQTAVGQLAVSEIFGPTFQGEGSSIGRRCYFLRLAGCNQHCSWCDTPYTWDWSGRNGKAYDPREEVHKYDAKDIVAELNQLRIDASDGTLADQRSMLVITGGEPLLQQAKLLPLVEFLFHWNWEIEIETAGTVVPHEISRYVTKYNISPKLENSGNELKTRYRPQVLKLLQAEGAGRVCWKFVARTDEDLAEIAHIVNECELSPVYVMPEGTDSETIKERMQELAAEVLKRGWNLTTRLQVELYGNRRGV